MAVTNNIAYIEKTLPKVVDKVFARDSLTDMLFGNSAVKLDWLDAKTIKIFKLASTGLGEYQRGGHGVDNTRGAVNTTTETFTLEQERYSEIPVDRLDSIDDAETVLGTLATEFIRTKVVPEFDCYRFGKLANLTSVTFGNRVEKNIGDNEIIKALNEAFTYMAEQKVPENNQVIFVSPTIMQKIRNTTELYKKLSQSEYRANVSFSIEKYENREIVVVPSDEFFTDVIIDKKNGYHPAPTSKLINFLVVDKSSVLPIKKLDFAKVYNSDGANGTYLGYQGVLLTNLYYHDIFVPENRRVGIYASVSTDNALTKSSSLLVDCIAGGSSNTVVRSVLTQPAGLIYDKLYRATTATVAIGSATHSLTPVVINQEFAPNPSHNVFVASYEGKAVAVSKDFTSTLPVGA